MGAPPNVVLPPNHAVSREGDKRKSKSSKLTPETILKITKTGATPLHHAIKNGTFNEIPRDILLPEHFLIQDNNGDTALHLAAKKRCLTVIPLDFFTWETLTATNKNGLTPLHVAAENCCINQIPAPPLCEDVLAFTTKNQFRESVVHVAARLNKIGLIPKELLTPTLLHQVNAYGQTPMSLMKENQATEKQTKYLRDLGVAFDETTLTKDAASYLIEEALASQRSAKPPSEAQRQKLIRLGVLNQLPENASMQDATDLLEQVLAEPITDYQIKEARESGFVLKNMDRIKACDFDDLVKLAYRAPEQDDLLVLKEYGLSFQEGNGISVRLAVALINQYDHYEYERKQIAKACARAVNDPAFAKPIISCDEYGSMEISWPPAKLREWVHG
jgi:ankyrin repeat protein